MMMHVLEAGGITPYWSKHREMNMMRGKDRYQPNPDKFLEIGQENYMRLGMVHEIPNHCAVKIQAIGLPILAPAKSYKIIYMRRDPEAIKRSYIKAFNEKGFDQLYPSWPDHYWQLLDGVKGIMQTRRDVDLIELWYDDVLANPEMTIELLCAHGVPIKNKQAAIDVIDPSHRRFEVA